MRLYTALQTKERLTIASPPTSLCLPPSASESQPCCLSQTSLLSNHSWVRMFSPSPPMRSFRFFPIPLAPLQNFCYFGALSDSLLLVYTP